MRPKSISIFCIILFIFFGFALFGSIMSLMVAIGVYQFEGNEGQEMVSTAVAALTVPAAIYGVLANVLTLVSLYALWKMKRWGVYLFGAIVGIGLIVSFVIAPPWAIKSEELWWLPFILPAIYIFVVIPSWKQLNGGF